MTDISNKSESILALDSATGTCSVALWQDGKISGFLEDTTQSKQSTSLLPMIESLLKETQTDYNDLSILTATVGPGSFTGIRIALAAARAICFAANIPARGYTTLQVLAYGAQLEGAQDTLAILGAGKGEHYYQYYRPFWHTDTDPQIGILDDILAQYTDPSITLVGNAKTDIATNRNSLTCARADVLAALAAAHPRSGTTQLSPFYIRPPDAKLPQSKQ